MLPLESARERILEFISPLPIERASLLEALGRFAAEPVLSPLDLPGFDNSAMDGYAVRSEDSKGAVESQPVSLQIIGRVAAGATGESPVAKGECVRVFTGSALPNGADAVVMQEDVIAQGTEITLREPIKPFENVRLRGEDIRAGSIILRAGERVTAARAGLLAATGQGEVAVRQKPRVALMSTGSELVEPGATLQEGKIYESNRTALAGLLHQMHCAPRILPLVADDLRETTAALERAFAANDFIISTGGVSVGEFDFVKEAFEALGGRIAFWKIAMRPGKPFVFGTVGGKFLFGLPGNPVSAFVTFLVLVRPALLKAMGAGALDLAQLQGELGEAIFNSGDRRHFARARWESGKVRLAGAQSSHRIGSLSEANCLIDIPAQTRLEAGTSVRAQFWDLPEGAA